MIIDALFEVVAPAIGRIVAYVFMDIIGHLICYNLGFAFLRVLSMGQYPKTYYPTRIYDSDESIVVMTGVFLFITLLIIGLIALS